MISEIFYLTFRQLKIGLINNLGIGELVKKEWEFHIPSKFTEFIYFYLILFITNQATTVGSAYNKAWCTSIYTTYKM